MLLPLRVFLGATFTFAGLQKLANPGFFDPANPASIQNQLAGAARHSPMAGLLGPMAHVAVLVGILVALGEIAAGLGTLLGLWTRAAAAGGMALSFGLFLTVSFHANPYYTGSDIVFTAAWLPLLLAGSGGVLSVDGLAANLARVNQGDDPDTVVPVAFSTIREVCGSFDNGTCRARRHLPCQPAACPYLAQRLTRDAGSAAPATGRAGRIDRRTLALRGAATVAVGGAGLLVAGLTAGIGRVVGGASATPPSPTLGAGPGPTTPGPTTPGPTTPVPITSVPTSAGRPAGTAIGAANQVPVGGAARFSDPASGDPSLVLQPEAGTFLAFDAICPHAGCVVSYAGAQGVLVCPCHGSVFNARTGAVEQGPSPSGLPRIRITQGPDGRLYVQ